MLKNQSELIIMTEFSGLKLFGSVRVEEGEEVIGFELVPDEE